MRLTHLAESYRGPNVQTEMRYYRQVRQFLRRGLPDDPTRPWLSNDEELQRTDLSRAVHLDLCGSEVTDKGLSRLTALPELQSLDLRFTSVTDEGLGHLGGLENLKMLRLGGYARNVGNNITDRGIDHLGKLVHLEILALSHTKITNKS